MMNEQDALRGASQLRAALPKVSELLSSVLQGATGKNEAVQQTARGLLDREICWLRTMSRLDKTDDFQAQMAGMRAMMELTIDLALLYANPLENAKLEAWELSSRFKHANCFVNYVGSSDKSFRAELARKFLTENAAAVQSARAQHWGGSTHPSRWTGKSLEQDAKAVHLRYPALGMERLYQEFYRYVCWQVHGSALTGTRGATAATMLAPIAIALKTGADLGFASAEFALRLFDQWTTHQLEVQRAHEGWLLRYGNIEFLEGQPP